MPIQPELGGYLGSGQTGNPVLDEISTAHANLSPSAQKAIEGAHGLLGISPSHSDSALASGVTPASAPDVAVPGVSGPRVPLPVLSPEGLIGVTQRDIDVNRPEMPLPSRGIESPTMDTRLAPKMAPAPSAVQMEHERLNAPPLPSGDPNAHTALDTGRPGVEQIHNPWARGLATVGDVIASGLFPRFGQFIPGTSAHHALLVGENQRAVNAENEQRKEDEAAERQEAETAAIPTETELKSAQTKEAEARAKAIASPPGLESEEELRHAQASEANARAYLAMHPRANSEFELWHQQNPNGKPEEFMKLQENIRKQPLTKESADAMNKAWSGLASKYKLGEAPFHEGMTPDESARLENVLTAATRGEQGAQKIIIQGQNASNSENKRRDAETQREYLKVHDRLTKGFDTFQKQDDALDQAEHEINGSAPAQAVGIMKTIVGLAGGQGSGVRLTTAELNGLTRARGYGDSFTAWLQKFGDGKQLSPNQVNEIKSILGDAKAVAEKRRGQYVDALDEVGSAKNVDEVRSAESKFNHSMIAPKEQQPSQPQRPKGVPDNAVWNPQNRTWSAP